MPTTSPTHQEQSSSTTAADHLATVQASTAATNTRADRHKIHRRATAHDRHALDRFRASDGHAPAPSGMPHVLSRAPSVPSRAPSPRYALGILPSKVVTTSRHKATLQGGGCFFSLKVCSKSQFALTVKNIACFQGVGLQKADFENFGF